VRLPRLMMPRSDIAHLCAKCGLYHQSKESWLETRFTAADYQMLEAARSGKPEPELRLSGVSLVLGIGGGLKGMHV